MSEGPWGTGPRRKRTAAKEAAAHPAGRFAISTLVVCGLFGAAVYGKYESDRSSDMTRMPTSAYGDLVTMVRVCPAMRRPIRAAMADGYLTRGEAMSLRRAADVRARAYAEAEARSAAARASGAPAIPVPPECEPTTSLLGVFETSD